MRPFHDRTGREKAAELLRWVCVFPAAVLGSFAVRFVFGLLSWLAVRGSGAGAESQFVFYVQLVLLHVPDAAAFVIAGAKIAPRSRAWAAILLAGLGTVLSLLKHVLLQPHPGAANYLHLAAESAGAACGIMYLLYTERARRT